MIAKPVQRSAPRICSFLKSDCDAPRSDMYREIRQQVHTTQDLIDDLSGQLTDLASRGWFRNVSCVDLVGIGSSFNAGHIAAAAMPQVKTTVQKSTAYRPVGDLFVGISQSGMSSDTLEAVQVAKANRMRVVGVTATEGSRLFELADEQLLLTLPEEKAIAATGSMTGTLLALQLLLAALNGRQCEETDWLARVLETLIDNQCRAASPLERLVESLADADYIVVLGDGPYEGVAHECALKIRETAGVLAEGMSPREYRHGPVEVLSSSVLARRGIERVAVLIEPGLVNPPATLHYYETLAAKHHGTDREFRMIRITLGQEDSPDDIAIPDAGIFTPLIAIVLLGQMGAHEIALRKGRVPGASDTLSKVVVTTA